MKKLQILTLVAIIAAGVLWVSQSRAADFQVQGLSSAAIAGNLAGAVFTGNSAAVSSDNEDGDGVLAVTDWAAAAAALFQSGQVTAAGPAVATLSTNPLDYNCTVKEISVHRERKFSCENSQLGPFGDIVESSRETNYLVRASCAAYDRHFIISGSRENASSHRLIYAQLLAAQLSKQKVKFEDPYMYMTTPGTEPLVERSCGSKKYFFVSSLKLIAD